MQYMYLYLIFTTNSLINVYTKHDSDTHYILSRKQQYGAVALEAKLLLGEGEGGGRLIRNLEKQKKKINK